MSVPVTSASPFNYISQVTGLLAAHGVYALTAIFIFYQQRRALAAMNAASNLEDHVFFRKVYTSVVAMTYTLMVLSTTVWFYSNFIYSQQVYIQGTVMGLTERLTSPNDEKGKPEIIQSIMPASAVELYENRKFTEGSSFDGKYDLGWVILPKQPRAKFDKLVFRFQQHYEVWQPAAPSADPFAASPASQSPGTVQSSQRVVDTVPGFFNLDLGNIHYSPGDCIQLMYEPDSIDQVKKIGKMYLLLGGRKVPLDWQPGDSTARADLPSPRPASGVSSLFGPFRIYAADLKDKPLFKGNGDYDPELAAVLREHLGSTSLSLQQDSIDILVQQRDRAFKFIADSLAVRDSHNFDDGLMKHNLAVVVDRLESQGVHAPPQLSLQLALTFYRNQDYKSAVRFFDRAGDIVTRDDQNLFYRAYAFNEVHNYERAVQDWQAYLRTPHKPAFDAVARCNFGNTLTSLKRDREAIEQYRLSMKSNPKYALAYNNLAYLYAERGQNLPEALELVNTAIRLEADDVNLAEEKDTKGWILFKLGKSSEALPLIQEAVARLPQDPDVQQHLLAVQKALPSQAK